MNAPVTSDSWKPYPSALDFGSVYLCADANGTMFRRMLTAGDARDSHLWPQVSWVLKAAEIPRPNATPPIPNISHVEKVDYL